MAHTQQGQEQKMKQKRELNGRIDGQVKEEQYNDIENEEVRNV